MQQIFYIGLGGFFGAVCRFLASKYGAVVITSFPLGTLFVNITGSFFLAFINYSVLQGKHVPVDFRSFMAVGFIGAYTTMSTFSYETMRYLDQGDYGRFILNFFLNIGLCLLAIALGRYCALLLSR